MQVKQAEPVSRALTPTWGATSWPLALFLVSPFAAQAIPKIGWMFWAALGVVSCQLVAGRIKSDTNFVASLSPAGLILALVTASVAYGIFKTEGVVSDPVWKDLARGVAFLVAAVLIAQPPTFRNDPGRIRFVQRSSDVLMGVAIAAGVAGYVKYIGLTAGYCIDLIAVNCQTSPWGTALVGDYNFYALTLLVGALLVLKKWTATANRRHATGWGIALGVIVFAGLYAGSRRFWIVAPIAIVFYSFVVSRQAAHPDRSGSLGALLLGVMLSLAVLQLGVWISSNIDPQQTLLMRSRLGSLLDSSDQFGLAARVERWRYGLSLVDIQVLFEGAGFSYRTDFGCHFQRCAMEDYPHAPVLSALLFSGAAGAVISLACVALAFAYSIQAMKSSWHPELGVAMIACIIFISVSGDTLLSAPAFMSLLLLLAIAADASRSRAACCKSNSK